MVVGIILAAGKGSRLKCKEKNKTSLKLNGKPLVVYGVELFKQTVHTTVVVVGAFAESVKKAIDDPRVLYARQTKRLGTGHAVRIAVQALEKKKINPTHVFLGYGDHMMSYTPEVIDQMAHTHVSNNAAITLVTSYVDDANNMALGRIIRQENGEVVAIVEQKDATPEQRNIKEINAGFYCFDYEFLRKNRNKLKKSPVTKEYYLTDFIQIAKAQGKRVIAHVVPFEHVGTGINTMEQLEAYNEDMAVPAVQTASMIQL